jgi:hypothetical protein
LEVGVEVVGVVHSHRRQCIKRTGLHQGVRVVLPMVMGVGVVVVLLLLLPVVGATMVR